MKDADVSCVMGLMLLSKLSLHGVLISSSIPDTIVILLGATAIAITGVSVQG